MLLWPIQPKWRLPLIVLVLVGLTAVAVLWYLRQPERMVEAALRQAATASSQRFVSTVVLENNEQTREVLGEEAQIELTLTGTYVRRENAPTAIQSNIQMSIASESLTVQLTGEARLLQDKAYIFIEKAPPLFPVLQKLSGQWIELPRGEGKTYEAPPAITEPLLTQIKFEKQEKIANENTHKYQAVSSQAGIVRFMDTLAHFLGTNLTQAQIDQLRTSTSEVKEVPVEVWVTPFSAELRQLKTRLMVPGGNTIVLNVLLTDRNIPQTLSTPDEAVSFEEAVAKLRPSPAP